MSQPPQDNHDRDRVRDASDIVKIIGEHVDLKPKGREYVGLCPFHNDNKPSMYVVPHKQIYTCFSCGAAGDVFKFVQDYHQMTFVEALKYLAEQAGITLTQRRQRRTKHDDQVAVERSHIKDANDTAQKFFRGILRHPEHGQPARDLIQRRGISDDMVEAFGIGAAPDRWDGLELFVTKKDLSTDVFLAAGLLKSRDSGTGRYDALRNRLVFPIRDQIGRTIAFGARRIDDEDEPKYLNSPETPLFDKSATLFGLDLAHRAIQRSGTAVIAEGYTDVIACHQAGINNVVATLGTALTPGHAKKLQQLCDTVVLLFDGDEAGQRAADRAAEVFLALPIDVRIATLAGATDAKDPDELLKTEGGDDILRSVFESAVDLLSFRDARLRAELRGAGPARIESRVRDEMRELGRLGLASADKVRWQFVIRQLHDITGLDTATIAALVREGAGRRPAPSQEVEPAPALHTTRTPIVEAVACLLGDPSIYVGMDDATKQVIQQAAQTTELAAIAQAIAAVTERSPSPTLAAVLDHLTDQRIDTAPAIALERDIARRLGEDPELIRNTLNACVQRLQPTTQSTATTSALDRIAELKTTRTGQRATDRTRLPRTRQ